MQQITTNSQLTPIATRNKKKLPNNAISLASYV